MSNAPSTMSPRTAVVVGNPKPQSRTLAAAVHVARELTGAEPDLVVDLATLGPVLLDWKDAAVADLVAEGGAQHALAPELSLRPVLTEIGATMPSRALYVLDTRYDDPGAYVDWLAVARPRITAQVDDLLVHRAGATA